MINWIFENPGICYGLGAIAAVYLVLEISHWCHRRQLRKTGWRQTRSKSDVFLYGELWEKIIKDYIRR